MTENVAIFRFHGSGLWQKYGTYGSVLEAKFAVHDYIEAHPPLPNTKAERDKLRASFEIFVYQDEPPLTDKEIESRERTAN